VGVLFFIKHWPYFLALQGGAGLKKGVSLPKSEREFQSLIRHFTKTSGISQNQEAFHGFSQFSSINHALLTHALHSILTPHS
jgi:hypothetical protein